MGVYDGSSPTVTKKVVSVVFCAFSCAASTYHLNIDDAETGNNMIANSHTISTAENGAVIYARIKIQLTLVLKPVLSLLHC
jgi:hypothetical protein